MQKILVFLLIGLTHFSCELNSTAKEQSSEEPSHLHSTLEQLQLTRARLAARHSDCDSIVLFRLENSETEPTGFSSIDTIYFPTPHKIIDSLFAKEKLHDTKATLKKYV